METGLMVYSWYQDDLWEPESLSHKMMRRVNAMHRHVAAEVRASASLEAEVARVLREADIDCEAELGHQDRELLADLATPGPALLLLLGERAATPLFSWTEAPRLLPLSSSILATPGAICRLLPGPGPGLSCWCTLA